MLQVPSRPLHRRVAASLVFAAVLTTVLIHTLPSARGESVADRKGAVLKDRSTLANDLRWIYDDFEKGFAEGRRTGRPVLIVLRCIPCLACIGIDSALLLENTELSPILDQFICVRVVNANALDLSRFEFDFDLSFSALFFNGDGTLYGRYGSWAHQKNPTDNATDGLRDTLQQILNLHAGYPANKDALRGKQAHPSPYKTPIDMPTLNGKYTPTLDWEGQVVKSCVHCHQIGDALRSGYRERKERMPAKLVYPFPAPETLGIHLAANAAATVRSVAADSIAARAGLLPSDQLLRVGGQPVVSAADVSWVLHHFQDSGSLPVVVRRNDQQVEQTLELRPGWRTQADISRRVGTWGMRAMALGGLLLEDLPDEERQSRSLKSEDMALRIQHVGEYNEHAAAKKAGFKKDDIIIQAAGSSKRETESALIGRLLADKKPGDLIPATVLRGTDRLNLQWPIQ